MKTLLCSVFVVCWFTAPFTAFGSTATGEGFITNPPVNSTMWTCLFYQNPDRCYDPNCYKGVVRLFQGDGTQTDSASSLTTFLDPRVHDVAQAEGYITPCFQCGNPEHQGHEACDIPDVSIYALSRLWFNVEDPTAWSSNHSENTEFIKAFTKAAKDKCQLEWPFVGIFASLEDWLAITGNSTDFSSDFALGYRRIDGNKSFDDFVPFGGWTKKTVIAKNYLKKFRACGMITDRVYYECSEDSAFPCDYLLQRQLLAQVRANVKRSTLRNGH